MNDSDWEDAISELAYGLIEKPEDLSADQVHPCPICGNPLSIHVGRYQRYAASMIGVMIECKTCNKTIAIDSVEG